MKKTRYITISLLVISLAVMSLRSFGLPFQESLIFHPQKLQKEHKYHYNATELFLKVEENINLNALLFSKPESTGLIIYFHGNAGNLNSWAEVQQDFKHLPYDFLIYDYRGYGKSDGKIKGEKSLHHDARMVYQEMKKQYENRDIILYGRSIGTGIASQLAVTYPPKILILETPYYNFPDLVSTLYPFIPSFLVNYSLPNDENLKLLNCPIHLIHGTDDELIPVDSSTRLAAVNHNISLHIIENAGHNNISNFEKYHAVVAKIFSENH